MPESENKSHVAIVIAVIGVLGTLGAALIGNWDKIFPRKDDHQVDATSEHGKPAAVMSPPLGTVVPQKDTVLREGAYELRTLNGAPQKRGHILRISKVSDDRYLADANDPLGSMWTGEFRWDGESWRLTTQNQRVGAPVPTSKSMATRSGALLTIGESEWEERLDLREKGDGSN